MADVTLTPEFPREPERSPSNDFEQAAVPDAHIQQLEQQKQVLESQRQTPEVQGMDYTPGGTVEQTVHTETFSQRETEIRWLQERITRHNDRTRGR